MLDPVTLDQLRILVAIVDQGSFTAAAKHLRRAQSAISHGVASLEGQLGLPLFDRTSKKPVLTAAGAAVLADARLALSRVETLKARAKAMAKGQESELGLAVTVLFPEDRLAAILKDFDHQFPNVRLNVFMEEIGGAALLVQNRVCQIGIAGTPSLRVVPVHEFVTLPIGEVEIVAVAAPHHPLSRWDRALTETDLAEHRQLIPTGRARSPYPNAMAREIWAINDLGFRRELILRGAGWGTLPLNLVAEDLAQKRLKRLMLASRAEELMRVALFAIHRLDMAPGPVATWLLRAFQPHT